MNETRNLISVLLRLLALAAPPAVGWRRRRGRGILPPHRPSFGFSQDRLSAPPAWRRTPAARR
ncbi:MAG: hypothetical protein SXV54_05330 [Chloroflexota bacterium]|nr:hypothetical protein [Chloroflexota bacterium]